MHTRVMLTAAALFLAACGERPAPTASAEKPAEASAPQPAWILTEMPEGAAPVSELKPAAKEGDRVTLIGRIGGRAEPFTEGSAVFVVMDPAVPSCADEPGDNCPRPWDYCCEPAESIVRNSATIVLTGPDGQPLATDPRSAGLAPLDRVVVVGTVGPRPSPEVFTIRAEGVYRVGG